MPLNFIDLFSGAGGLSEGFFRNGYEDIAHIDMVQDACNTIKTRKAFYYLKNKKNLAPYIERMKAESDVNAAKDLWQFLPPEELDKSICQTLTQENTDKTVEKIKQLSNSKKIDVVVGGPPCQAYSIVGRARKKDGMEGDPRNYLYQIYFSYIKALKPKVFVFENVKGLLTAGKGKYLKDIEQIAADAGYKFTYRIVNSRDFGVLQQRERIIIFGAKNPDYADKFWEKLDSIAEKSKNVYSEFIVNDLLSDLPKLSIENNVLSDNHYATKPTKYLTTSGIRNDKNIPLSLNFTRRIRPFDQKIYRYVIDSWKNHGHQRFKYNNLPENLKTHRNNKSFLDRFKIVEYDMPSCHTMVAHISKDGHYFIHPDYEQARSLTLREAARIQSFPDDYFFEGSRTSIFVQIGNAVPPLLSDAIAKAIKHTLSKKNKAEE